MIIKKVGTAGDDYINSTIVVANFNQPTGTGSTGPYIGINPQFNGSATVSSTNAYTDNGFTNALNLPGNTGDYVDTGVVDLDIPASTEFAIECFVRLDVTPTGTTRNILSYSASTEGWWLGHYAGAGPDNLYFYIQDGGSVVALDFGVDLTQNTWTHLAVAKNSSNLIQAYVDGTRVASTTVAAGHTAISEGLLIGGRGTETTPFSGEEWSGQICGVRVTLGSNRGYDGATLRVPTRPLPTF